MVKKTDRKHASKQIEPQAYLEHLDQTGLVFRDAYYSEGLLASGTRTLMTGCPNIDPKEVENFSTTAGEIVGTAEEYKRTLMGYVIPV